MKHIKITNILRNDSNFLNPAYSIENKKNVTKEFAQEEHILH